MIGFCGAPWTVATYMVAGHGTPDQAPAKTLAAREPASLPASRSIAWSRPRSTIWPRQLDAGADVVQIFDTWAGSLPPEDFERWCVQPTKRLVGKLRAEQPGRQSDRLSARRRQNIPRYVEETGVDAVSLGNEIDRAFARDEIQTRVPVQGNLDPLALLAGGAALDREVDDVLAALRRTARSSSISATASCRKRRSRMSSGC